MIPSQEANEEVEKTEVKEDVESKETEDQPVVDGASGSSWWGIPTGGYSSWMNKAVSSVTVATELAKQKSTEVYGLVAKDLEEVSSQATTMVKSSSMTLKNTFEWDWYYSDPCLPICVDDDGSAYLSTTSDDVRISEFYFPLDQTRL